MESIIFFIVQFWLPLVLAGLSALCAALFAVSETAIIFSNKPNLRHLSESGNARATVALTLAQEQRGHLRAARIVVGHFFIILSAALGMVIAVGLPARMYPAAVVVILLIIFIIIFFAKRVLQNIAGRNFDRFALMVAPLLNLVITILAPVLRLIFRSVNFVIGPGPQSISSAEEITEEDIKAMINLSEERGSLKEEEKELLHKVFEFGDTLASEAMRPRTEIVSVPADATLKEVFPLVSEFGYSRYPVIENTIDTVVGILYIKDILVAMASGEVKRGDNIQTFIRPAYFIPENKRVSELLSEMQRDRFQIAIVIDEYGGTAGLVTLEDLIEEIVGSIHDELGAEEKDVQIVDEKNFMVSGQSGLDEVNELLDTNLQSREFNTLGGFVFGLFGRMPKVGEQLKYKNLKFEVLDLEGRKISKIKITRP